MMKEQQKKAYKTLFKILDKIYVETKSDDLGALLGGMNPYLFSATSSADPAAYEDFCNCLKECCKNTFPEDVKEAYTASIKFLEYYKDEFGFNIDEIIELIDFQVYEAEYNKS